MLKRQLFDKIDISEITIEFHLNILLDLYLNPGALLQHK